MSPGVDGTLSVACFVISTGSYGPDELIVRFGGDVPGYSMLQRENCAEPTYLFIVDQAVNVEGICADFGFDCVRMFDGYVSEREYNSRYRFNVAQLEANRLVRLQPDEDKKKVKKWAPRCVQRCW